jgi:hypothetical protein
MNKYVDPKTTVAQNRQLLQSKQRNTQKISPKVCPRIACLLSLLQRLTAKNAPVGRKQAFYRATIARKGTVYIPT